MRQNEPVISQYTPPTAENYYVGWEFLSDKRQAYTQEYALYAANLIYQDTHAVIKVIRYGLNIKCFPDEHTVALVERQIAKQKQRRENEELPTD